MLDPLKSIPQDKITWMLEDVNKYLKREVRREHLYQGIVLDPPTFGSRPIPIDNDEYYSYDELSHYEYESDQEDAYW